MLKLIDMRRIVKNMAFDTLDIGSCVDSLAENCDLVIDYANKRSNIVKRRKDAIAKGAKEFDGTDLTADMLSVKAGISYFMDAFDINKEKAWHLVDYVAKLEDYNTTKSIDKANDVMEKVLKNC